MDVHEINDVRKYSDFKGKTFSDFKKVDVKKELLNSLIQSKIEPACYWSAELICAGHYTDLWDLLLLFYTKYVHLGNPKIATYLDMRIQHFKECVANGFLNDELRLRNHGKIRRLFCEIMCVLCGAKRKHCFEDIKIKKEEFDMTQITDKFKAPDVSFIEPTFQNGDPKELYIALNELAYHVNNKSMNGILALYWIEWVMEFESICKNNKTKLKCLRRTFPVVESKYQMDVIWLVWDVLIHEANTRNKFVQNVMQSALSLYCLKYTSTSTKKRKYALYFAVELLTGVVLMHEEIIKEKEQVKQIVDKIDTIYKQIKQNEISPNTDYLFSNVGRSNLEKTVEKLEKMNSLGAAFIPRTEESTEERDEKTYNNILYADAMDMEKAIKQSIKR